MTRWKYQKNYNFKMSETIVLVGAAIAFFGGLKLLKRETFTWQENDFGEELKRILEQYPSMTHIPEISEDDLATYSDKILMARVKDGTKEHFALTSDWPIPPLISGGGWSPPLYSKLRNWYPSFNVSGWSWWMRPGYYRFVPGMNGAWARNNGNFYYINNP